MEWLGLERTLKIIGQGHLPLDQVAKGPIQPGLEPFQREGNLFQFLTTHKLKGFFLISNLNLPSFS